jgi:hypothetical protein
MEPTEREEVVAGSFQSVVEAELQKPKHSLAREKEVGSRAHDQTLRGYRVGSGVGRGVGNSTRATAATVTINVKCQQNQPVADPSEASSREERQ